MNEENLFPRSDFAIICNEWMVILMHHGFRARQVDPRDSRFRDIIEKSCFKGQFCEVEGGKGNRYPKRQPAPSKEELEEITNECLEVLAQHQVNTLRKERRQYVHAALAELLFEMGYERPEEK